MTNKIGIGVEAQFDPGAVEQQINAMGQKIAQANKVQFKPVSNTTIQDLDKVVKRFEQLLRINGDLNKRMKATGQGGKNMLGLDWDSLYPDPNSRARQMRKVFEYSVGPHFSGQAGGGGGGGPRPPPGPAGSPWAGVATGAAQAGMRAAGPAGGVAAGALGTGMSAGFGAGLMGLMGGMLALGIGKIVGAATENIGKAEDNAVALDRLKRTLGDVNVSFDALKAVVHGGADNLKITYAEAGQLATQFAKLGNLSSDQFKSLSGELGVGVGMSRAYGLDPSQGVGVMGQMRGVGVTSNTQESRRFAMLLGETIGKSGAFAKAEEVMEAIGGFATSQTRSNMGVANVAGYAGMYSAMVGSGVAGLDPTGAAAMLSRVNSSLSGGGSKGEASQFFTAQVGSRMGLDPIQTQIMREGGAFATNDSMFGEGSAASRFGIKGPGGNKTFLQESLSMLRRQYGGNPGLLAQATANHLGIGINQAMTMLSIKPNEIGEMQQYGDLGKLSGTGIGNMSKALYGSGSDRQSLARSLLGRDDVSQSDKLALSQVMAGGTESEQKDILAKLTAQYDQERTTGSDIRDSKNALDNIKTSIADKMVPLMNSMRLGIMHIAGKGEKSPKQIMEEVMRLEGQDRISGIKGTYAANLKDAASAPGGIRADREKILNELRRDDGSMSAEDKAGKQKRIQELTEQLFAAEEKARLDVIRLKGEEAKALKDANTELEKDVKAMRDQGSPLPVVNASLQSTAETARLGRLGVSAGAASESGGRSYTTGGSRVSSGFGSRIHPITGQRKNHNGIDFAAPLGTSIQATADGEVTRSGMSKGGYGNVIEIRHADGSVTRYAHNKSNGVKVGENVKAGQVIGKVGSTGRSTGSHLHYEVLKDGKATDPNLAFNSGEHRRPIAGVDAPDLVPKPSTVPSGGMSQRAGANGPLSGEMSVRLDLSPEAMRLLQKPQAPVSTRVAPARPFGASGGW
jgi:murein DD-endopeptidase MepM/ murein hydrolase activator NlpD